ncbi:shikimate kinase [Streptomyces sp. Pv4-95]|uniref:shikimate kinase n=1 Tax=Streptomyces sp. Pv4-95 TaxID=3049543 RepID=UPI003891DBF5
MTGQAQAIGPGPAAVLVGPMGAGKSTAGRSLAQLLGTTFRDTDADIVAAAGRPIARIFADEGEPHFRDLEREAVRVALENHTGVLALGGGAILDADTRELLAGLPVVFLEVDADEAVRRMAGDASRPLLAVNLRTRWRGLMSERRPLYEEVARTVVRSDGLSPDTVAERILDALAPARAEAAAREGRTRPAQPAEPPRMAR